MATLIEKQLVRKYALCAHVTISITDGAHTPRWSCRNGAGRHYRGRWSSPAKYCLTEAGRQVAEQLDVVLPAGAGVTVPQTLSSTGTFQPAASAYGSSARPEPFYYWFLDLAGTRTRFRDSAAVSFDGAAPAAPARGGASLQRRANRKSAARPF